MPYGWGTGGVQVTAAVIGPDDVLKVIDQAPTTRPTRVDPGILSVRRARRHDDEDGASDDHPDPPPDPRVPLRAGQILVYQVPIPEPLRFLEPRETETRTMHALEEYGLMHVKLYEDIARHGTSRPPTPIP